MPVSDYVNRSSVGHIAVFAVIIIVSLLIFGVLERLRIQEERAEAVIQLDMSEIEVVESAE